MTRRTLIRRVLVILGLSPAWSIWMTGCMFRGTASGRPGGESTVLDLQPKSGPLSLAEMETLVAFGEVVVEGRTLEPAERRSLIEYLEDRTGRSPGDLAVYQTTATTLDRLAAQPFVRLDVRERAALIARHRLGDWQGSSGEAPDSIPTEIRSIRAHVVPNLIHAYYASPAGWAIVGYETFPGRCGDLTRYTRPE